MKTVNDQINEILKLAGSKHSLNESAEQVSPRVEKLLLYCKHILHEISQETDYCINDVFDIIEQIDDILGSKK